MDQPRFSYRLHNLDNDSTVVKSKYVTDKTKTILLFSYRSRESPCSGHSNREEGVALNAIPLKRLTSDKTYR